MITSRVFRFALTLVVVLSGAMAQADRKQDVDRLIDLLQFEETVAIMREEGLRYGGQVAEDMLPDADMKSWQATVSQIYDADKMLSLISADFHDELSTGDLSPLLAYFSAEDGREIVEMELAARRAFLTREIEEKAIDRFNAQQGEDSTLKKQVEQVIDESDLIEFNVMGTLNSSMMFYRGLREGGAYDVTDAELLADVWSQEDGARSNSEEWLGAFLTMAYEPLTPEQLDGYAALYRTTEGRELNRAIFAAFDQMYEELSYLLGLAVADHMTSEPL